MSERKARAKNFAFTRKVRLAFMDIYPQIVRRRMERSWTNAGHAETVPMAMPPEAR